MFGINQHASQDGSGSPSERFFKRRIRSGLPSIIKKEIKHEDLMRIKTRKQLETAKKKGRVSADTFEMNQFQYRTSNPMLFNMFFCDLMSYYIASYW